MKLSRRPWNRATRERNALGSPERWAWISSAASVFGSAGTTVGGSCHRGALGDSTIALFFGPSFRADLIARGSRPSHQSLWYSMVLPGSGLSDKTLYKHQGDQCLGVHYLPAAHHLHDARPGQRVHFHELIPLAVGRHLPKYAGQEEVDSLVGEAGRGIDRREPPQLLRFIPRLFGEFPPGALLGLFPRLQPAGRDFPDRTVGRVPELADQHHAGVGCRDRIEQRHHRRGTGVADHLQRADGAIREADLIDIEI